MKSAGRFATLLLAVCQMLAVAAAEPWHVAEQPELKQALKKAPVLQTESLGEPARGVNVWERWFVPNPDGKSWDVLQIYFKEYYGPTWLHAVDLGETADAHQKSPPKSSAGHPTPSANCWRRETRSRLASSVPRAWA